MRVPRLLPTYRRLGSRLSGLRMIVSHRHGFVFMHVPKAAGTSLTYALSSICGPEDIIAASADDPTTTAALRSWGVRWPQNARVPVWLLGPRAVGRFIRSRRWPRLRTHAPARRARRLVGRHAWQRYLTFAVERNPWDKAVSRYWFERKMQLTAAPDFATFVRKAPRRKLSSRHIYMIRGRLAVDRVLRFDRLEEELPELWETLGEAPPSIPRIMEGIRPPETRDWRSMYTDQDPIDRIARTCAPEIAKFGFKFDE